MLARHDLGGTVRRSFALSSEASQPLGALVSLRRVHPWGMLLFSNLHQAIYEALSKSARWLMSMPELREKLVQQRDKASGHPTEAAHLRFFSSKAAWHGNLELQVVSFHQPSPGPFVQR